MSSLKQQFEVALEHNHARNPLDKSAKSTLSRVLTTPNLDLETLQNEGLSLDQILEAAAYTDNVSMIESCLDAGAVVTEAVTEKAHSGSGFEAYRLLVNRGGLDVNQHFSYSGTPLGRALVEGNMDFVTLCINAGADLQAHCFAQYTPIELVLHRHMPMSYVKVLVDHGAKFPQPGLVLKSVVENNTTMLEYVLDFKRFDDNNNPATLPPADPNETVQEGGAENVLEDHPERTVLHLAASRNYIDAAKILLSHGASVASKDRDGKSPFDIATEAGHLELAKLLAENTK